MELIFFDKVTNGRPSLHWTKKFELEARCFDGKDIVILIKKKKKTRSLEQNRWMWACTTILSNELGYDKEEMHEIIKYKFLTKEKVNETTGEVLKYVGSTASLTTFEFTQFMEALVRWAAETFSIILPYPGEQTEMNIGS